LIGPFECAVYARMRVIGQAPLYWRGAFFWCPCPFDARARVSVLLEFVPYRTLVLPGDSGWYSSAAYNGAVVAEMFIPAFGQRLAEEITYWCEYRILVYLKFRLFACSIASLLYEICELPFVLPVVEQLVTLMWVLWEFLELTSVVCLCFAVYIRSGILPYKRFILPCECSTVDTSCESASWVFCPYWVVFVYFGCKTRD